jgi:hypothetical protein
VGFRPVRIVREPTGREWELYKSRTTLPSWQEGADGDRFDDFFLPGPLGLLSLPFMLVATMWSTVIEPGLRFLLLLPAAIVKGTRSHAMRIEAVSYFQVQETRVWTTTSDMADSVLNQIALGLEEGKIVQPIGSVYSGSHTDG